MIDFELVTGFDTPSFHRPRSSTVKNEDIDEPDDLGVKARAFSRFVKAAERVLGTSLLAPTPSSRVRSLAAYGLPPISGFLERACFAGKEQTANLLEHVLAAVDRVQAHRAQKTTAAGAERKKPVGAWGNAIWIKWADYGVIRGALADLPHDGHSPSGSVAASCAVPPLPPQNVLEPEPLSNVPLDVEQEDEDDLEGQPDVLAAPHPMRRRRRKRAAAKHPMRREPLPGPEDEDGQDSDTENVDYAIETDPSIVMAPCPSGSPGLQPEPSEHCSTRARGRKKAAAAAPWAWPALSFPSADHPWCKRPPAAGREARIKPKERKKLLSSYAELDSTSGVERRRVCRTIPEETSTPEIAPSRVSADNVPRQRPRPSWRTDNHQSKYPRWSTADNFLSTSSPAGHISSSSAAAEGVPRPSHETEYSWHAKQYVGSGQFERDLDDQLLRLRQLVEADETTRAGLYPATERQVAATLTRDIINSGGGRRAAAKLVFQDSFLYHHQMNAGSRKCPFCTAARSETDIRNPVDVSTNSQKVSDEIVMEEEPAARSSVKRCCPSTGSPMLKRPRVGKDDDHDPMLEELLQYMTDEVLQPQHDAAIPVSSSSSSSSSSGEPLVGDPGSAGLAAQNDPPFEVFDIFEGDTYGLDDP